MLEISRKLLDNYSLVRLKNCPVILLPKLVHIPIRNIFGKFWQRKWSALIGVSDFRPRIGVYKTPFDIPSNTLYKMPKLEFINDSLSDLLDARALEIYNTAKNQNKKIAIMWSGGIDSTLVLTAFLKNIPNNDKHLLNVVFDTNSILENIEFHQKYISNKLNCIHYRTFNLTEEFLKEYILLHGDPADCLFGPSTPKYRHFISTNQHLTPWKNHMDTMATLLDNTDGTVSSPAGFGAWLVNKIGNNIEDSGQTEYVSRIADWWWWAYFNFRWEFSCQRPFFLLRREWHKKFSWQTQTEFAKNTFFNTDKFQLWSYSNLKRNIPTHENFLKLHKLEAKEYIYEFTKDDNYFNSKRKTTARPANMEVARVTETPVTFDADYCGISKKSQVLSLIRLCLEKYKG